MPTVKKIVLDGVELELASSENKVDLIEQFTQSGEVVVAADNVGVKGSGVLVSDLAKTSDLSNLASKDDLTTLATKDDIKDLATKDEIKDFATKDDIKDFVTDTDLEGYATTADLAGLATTDYVDSAVGPIEVTGTASQEGIYFTLTAEQHTRVLNNAGTIVRVTLNGDVLPLSFTYVLLDDSLEQCPLLTAYMPAGDIWYNFIGESNDDGTYTYILDPTNLSNPYGGGISGQGLEIIDITDRTIVTDEEYAKMPYCYLKRGSLIYHVSYVSDEGEYYYENLDEAIYNYLYIQSDKTIHKSDNLTDKQLATNDYVDARVVANPESEPSEALTSVKIGNVTYSLAVEDENDFSPYFEENSLVLGDLNSGGGDFSNFATKEELETAMSGKQDTLTAGTNITITNNVISSTVDTSSLVTNSFTANRALISNSSGKVAVSDITSTELNYLDGVTSNIQTQINNMKSGAVSTVLSSNLTASRVLVSNSSGKIAASSSITSTELDYLDGVTSNIQTQINNINTAVSALPTHDDLEDFTSFGRNESTYEVQTISGVTYGFTLGSDGYYASTNKSHDSFSLCKVVFNLTEAQNIVVSCYQSSENGYDYGILSTLDKTLTSSATADSTNVFASHKGLSGNATTTYTNVSAGEHSIYVKYRKDGSQHSGSDVFKFKIEPLSGSVNMNIITDGTNSIDLTTKQDTLVSGTNIKTINGESILGEGDIVISGGSGGGSGYNKVEITEFTFASSEGGRSIDASRYSTIAAADAVAVNMTVNGVTNTLVVPAVNHQVSGTAEYTIFYLIDPSAGFPFTTYKVSCIRDSASGNCLLEYRVDAGEINGGEE